jgi:excisionase family DNA binding protein
MDSIYLTTKDVARLCQVSDATVKRWAVSGLIKSERTSGGHRRFRADEVARFQKETRLGVKRRPGDETVVTAATRRRVNKELSDSDLFHSLVNGKEEEVANILIRDFLSGTSLSEIFDASISGSMKRIGELWYEGKLSVAHEHLATRAALCAVHKLRGVVPVENSCRKLMFCFAIEGDFHELSSHLAQMVFESEGWEVMNFGANTPLFSVADEVIHHSPDLICISSTIMSDVERFSRDYEDFRKRVRSRNLPIVLGGAAFEDSKIHHRFPANHYPETFTDLAEIARKYAC